MNYIPLPTPDQPLLEITTVLDGEQFTILYDWNSVTDRWSMTVSDASGEFVAVGVKMVSGAPLLRPIAADNRPKGLLLIQSVNNEPMTISNIDECKLVYFDESEVVRT